MFAAFRCDGLVRDWRYPVPTRSLTFKNSDVLYEFVFTKFQVLGLLLNREPLLFTTSGDGKIFFRFSGRMMCVKIYFGLYASIEHFSTSSAMNYSLELKFMKLCKSKIDVEL